MSAAAAGRRRRGIEDEILRLEAEVPGVGGLYFDVASQKFTMFLMEESRRGAAVAAVRQLGARLATRGHIGDAEAALRAGDVVIRQGTHAFSELRAWSEMLAAELMGRPGYLAIDADESRNQVTVTVRDPAARGPLDALLASLGIPSTAVNLKAGYPMVSQATLRSTRRPTVAGLQIKGSEETCSLGWNVTTDQLGEEGFLTASHCSAGEIGAGATGETMFQATTSALGTVAINPAWTQGVLLL